MLPVNRWAEALLSQGKFLHVSKNRLLARGPRNTSFGPLLTRVLKTALPESIALLSEEGSEDGHVSVSCLSHDPATTIDEKVSLLVLITQPHHQRIATVRQLMCIFNFHRLRRVLREPWRMALEVFALEQGVKMTTIRSQMASVHTKARVKRQTDLT